MTGMASGHGPTYISSHSADVILSDIRPIKLQIDALRCINVLLDEFLYSVLSSARSLSTDKLRAGLLKVLPTSLGKDALLEAEVELRAYWDRTVQPTPDSAQQGDDQGKNFHLQWVFELLRLKCEAYSTLNESDEDPEAEARLQNRMGQSGGLTPPKSSLVAPASMYLTAILESVCEHILSNVGRVAARDSSRTSATVHDLFVALCEDDSIYSLFKSMKIYEQVESLSKASKPRRSKSSTRLDKPGTPSPRPELTSFNSSSRRTSSESAVSMATAVVPAPPGLPNPRASFDKTKAMKIFNRVSADRDTGHGESQRGHKKTDSILSEDHAKRTQDGNGKPFEDAAMLQEFDNLMRSDATMRMSLTPDRLKSMDVHNREKSQRSNRLAPKPETRAELDPPSISRAIGRRPSLRHVDSIVEDDEDISPSNSRARSSSTSHPPTAISAILKKSSRTEINTSAPPTSATSTVRRRPVPKILDPAMDDKHSRRIAPDTFEIDDAAGRSDEEQVATPSRRRTPHAVSADTRDLIDFLSQGPPDDSPPPVSLANPSAISLDNVKAKGSGRLQRMMSKLSIGSSHERVQSRVVNGGNDDFSRKLSRKSSPTAPVSPSQSMRSTAIMIPAQKPIPPPPPRPPPISPPSSSQESLPERAPTHSLSPNVSASRSLAPSDYSLANSTVDKENRLPPHSRVNGDLKNGYKKNTNSSKPLSEPITEMRNGTTNKSLKKQLTQPTVVPAADPAVAGHSQLLVDHAREMQRLFLNATSVDECRLIFDMFLAKSGINGDAPTPPPSFPLSTPSQSLEADVDLEHSLVELLLGGGGDEYLSLVKPAAPEVTDAPPAAVPVESNGSPSD